MSRSSDAVTSVGQEILASNIRNHDTRCAYVRAVSDFIHWCQTEVQLIALTDRG
ncbi:MAG TPA: hypothetical protein PLP93_11405 [Nitrosomonas sp.]|nr:hypothetical protein [Nitrosomonas sp.]HRB46715.1 hypothetical protein [Nitrosomonas sp.]